jgi:cytochrome P450
MRTVALGYKVTSVSHIPNPGYKQLTLIQLSKSPFFDVLVKLQSYGLYYIQQRLLRRELKQYNAFIEDVVDNRIATYKAQQTKPDNPSSASIRKDLFNFLLEAKDPKTHLPAFTVRDHLLSEARLLVLAGTDTTSTTLSALFFYLSHYPRVLAKLIEEIRSTFSSIDEVVYGPTLSKCKYLRACVDETLRMSFPAPSELSRVVLSGGAIIDGNAYPAGTIVGCPGFAIGWNEAVYGDANIFRPERWIPSSHPDTLNPEADVQKLRQCFHPFSIGPMNCAGQNLAMLELLLVSARTIWRTDLRLASGQSVGEGRPQMGWGQRSPKQYIVKDAYLSLKDGPILQFRRREG